MMALKYVLVLALVVLSPSVATARAQIGTVQLNGHLVILYDDGFWRYADEAGVKCTSIDYVGEVCAMPAQWARFPLRVPDALRLVSTTERRPVFARGDRFMAVANSLSPVAGDREITLEDVRAFIGNRTFHNGLKGIPSRVWKSQLDGLPGYSLWVNLQNGQVKAFTFASKGQRVIIAETTESGTTMFGSEHVEAHESFVKSLKVFAQ